MMHPIHHSVLLSLDFNKPLIPGDPITFTMGPKDHSLRTMVTPNHGRQFFFLILKYWGLNLGLFAWQADILLLELPLELGFHFVPRLAWTIIILCFPLLLRWQLCVTTPSFFSPVRWGLSFLCRLLWNHDAPNLISCIAWDIRCTLLCPAFGWDGGLINYLLRMAVNSDSLSLSLPSSYDHRCEPLAPCSY
jgi:hypothetical protein